MDTTCKSHITNTMALYIEDLEKMMLEGCSNPDCKHKHHDELFLTGQCHPGNVNASYTKGSGEIKLTCRQCGNLIVAIAVASNIPPQGEPV